MANNTNSINKLPSIFRTETERKFFDATFDQVFSKKNAERLTGFIGRRTGDNDLINDFYLPEPTKDRTRYQLEPTAYTIDPETLEKSNEFFYTDMINKIRFYSGNVGNHDRLFNSDYYSYSPPINIDKFLNFQNYYWIPSKISTINITGMSDLDILVYILNKNSFSIDEFNDQTGSAATPAGLILSNDMIVTFPNSASYTGNFTVTGVGTGIHLLPVPPDLLSVKQFSLLFWDNNLDSLGIVLDNKAWDELPWDGVSAEEFIPDYITMKTGSIDQNAWSRTNKWYHIDTINATMTATGNEFPANTTRAIRPIIEFYRNLQLYKSGAVFYANVNYYVKARDLGDPLNCISGYRDPDGNIDEITFGDIQGADLELVKTIPLFSDIAAGQKIVFPCDLTGAYTIDSRWDNDNNTITDTDNHKWDNDENDIFDPWDTEYFRDENGIPIPAKNFVWFVNEVTDSQSDITIIVLTTYSPNDDDNGTINAEVNNGDIILIIGGFSEQEDPHNGHLGETYYFEDGTWLLAKNEKVRTNQPIKFELYDTDRIPLHSEAAYPLSNFRGSEIFSYMVDTNPTAFSDPVLGFPLVYKSLGQISDIMFENDLITNRYIYAIESQLFPVTGYYYYRTVSELDDANDNRLWKFDNSWYSSTQHSIQRVIDSYTVFDTNKVNYIISVAPLDGDIDNIEVEINGEENTTFQYDIINNKPNVVISTRLNVNDLILIRTYTYDMLHDDARGYFEIPQQLEANPSNQEIEQESYGEFAPHFASIINNQDGITGVPFGNNNYRDTLQDVSLGTFILQNESSLLKTMFVSSDDDVNVVGSIRFSQNEYVNFKSKFLKVIRQLDVKGFIPQQTPDDLSIDLWLEEVLNILTISKEFSNSFAYSYMIARSDVVNVEANVVDVLDEYIYPVDITNPKNTLYLYKLVDNDSDNIPELQILLLVDTDYVIVEEIDGATTIKYVSNGFVETGDTIIARMYENPPPAYIPSTPAKLGMASSYTPLLTLDNTYSTPIYVIVGHDGSRSPAYGQYTSTYDINGKETVEPLVTEHDNNGKIVQTSADIRDSLLLELEKRIYNGLNPRFREDQDLLLTIYDIRPGAFRQGIKVSDEFPLDTTGSSVFTPAANNRYTRDEYYKITESYFAKWTSENKADAKVNEFYDSDDWKTWNYSSQTDNVQYIGAPLPGNWRGIFNFYYDTIRPDTNPWEMLGFTIEPEWWITEYGSGPWAPNAEDDADARKMWLDIESGVIRHGVREGTNDLYIRFRLTDILPVDESGILRDIVTIFDLPLSQWDGQDAEWIYGDGAPVEQAWYDSSEYYFSQTEFFYLMKPAEFGEKFWNPAILIEVNEQLLNKNTNERLRNSDILVHGEIIDNQIIYQTGYQQYISDRLLFLGKDITKVFGAKIRTLDVNLGHKMASFTNEDTIRMLLESSSVDSDTGNLVVPTTNYQVSLYTGASIRDYVYSGVIIRANVDETFTIYGYDLLDQAFKTLPPNIISRSEQINQGGTPASFKVFEFNHTYSVGDIVQYNTYFYQAIKEHIANSFITTNWFKLSALPEIGGISVTYYPDRMLDVQLIPYGTVLHSPQEVYDFLIGYGKYLESQGWDFNNVNNLNQPLDWKYSGEQFLFWVVNNWAPNNALFLSPASTEVKLTVFSGYPSNVESLSNGVYSILNKEGITIPPANTLINRDDKNISVIPTDGGTGVYYFRVSAAETEHILMFDNITEFNDTIYNPLLRTRQNRLTFSGMRTLDWFGKLQASGYLVQDNSLLQNFENITSSITDYYNDETALDNTEIDAGAKHLIGYENREYLDQLSISDDVQYNFYQGFIKQKGTANAIEKITRSDEISDNATTDFFEEWAIKLGDFGGTAENAVLEFLSTFDDVTGNPQTYRFNYVPSTVGSVKNIIIYNAESLYEFPPIIDIAPPTAIDVLGLNINRNAIAIAVLNDKKILDRIDLLDSGSGYEGAPIVTIIPLPDDLINTNSLDVAFSVFQPNILSDDPGDTIIEIDIDDTERWLLRPHISNAEFVVPTTSNSWTSYQLPNAGYAHKDDVNFLAFNEDAMYLLWNVTDQDKPNDGQLIWVAANSQEDWGVYLLMDISAASNLREGTDDVVLIDIDSTKFEGDTTLSKSDHYFNSVFTHPCREFNSDSICIDYDYDADSMVNLSGMIAITILDENISEVYQYNWDETQSAYILSDDTGMPVSYSDIYSEIDIMNAVIVFDFFVNMRYSTLTERDTFNIPTDILTWIDTDKDVDGVWVVETIDQRSSVTNGVDTPTTHRKQRDLVNTELFENSIIRDKITNNENSRLPVYDPFKDLIAIPPKQNIKYTTFRDPARYSNSDDPRLIDNNNLFEAEEVGQIWWDLTNIRYFYYEQPAVTLLLDDPVEQTHNLSYRRDNWGKLFPGSIVDIYEWTRSNDIPARYTGDGIPRNTTDYVEVKTFNSTSNTTTIKYYFWVKDKTTVPNTQNRTIPSVEVARYISNPKAMAYGWYAPIHNNVLSTSIIFANVGHILANKNTIIRVNFREEADTDNVHTEWKLFREGDDSSEINDVLWDKMVNSLVGYTIPLPSEDYTNGLPITDDLIVLPVPDVTISEAEKQGLGLRPQQSMFVDIYGARKILVQTSNRLLNRIKLWLENYQDWDADIDTNRYWGYVDWFEVGFNETNTNAQRQVESVTDLDNLRGVLLNGELVKVAPFVADENTRYEIYSYSLADDVFTLVRKELGTINLFDSMYLDRYSINLRTEIRGLLSAFKNIIFVGSFFVDQNILYFSMVNYSFSEGKDIDWAFKTTYITFIQKDILLAQQNEFRPNLFEEFITYVQEAKPYHTQIRDSISTYTTGIELAYGTAFDDAIGEWDEDTNTWVNDSITDNLRYFNILLDYSRVWCSEKDKLDYESLIGKQLPYPNSVGVCNTITTLTGNGFVLGWDFDETGGILTGYDPEGVEITTTLTPLGWDTLTIDEATDGEKPTWDISLSSLSNVIGDNQFDPDLADTTFDGSFFNLPNDIPEELVLVNPNENIVLKLEYKMNTSEDIKYNMNISSLGYTEYVRVCDNDSTALTNDITFNTASIMVDDTSVLPEPKPSIPGIVWIDAERVEYSEIIGNTLINIRRGTLGTTIFEHKAGASVIDGSRAQYIPLPDSKTFTINDDQRIDLIGNRIEILGMDDLDVETFILGQQSFNTDDLDYAFPTDVEFINGLRVTFNSSDSYTQSFIVEGAGLSMSLLPIQTPMTDPWFFVHLDTSGNPEVDENGDVIMSLTSENLTPTPPDVTGPTKQGTFLAGCQ